MNLQTVYGSLMHHRAEVMALGEQVNQPPYNKAPSAPVLYIKPANTFNAFGQTLRLQDQQTQLHARTCVGLILERNRSVDQSDSAQNAIKLIANMACRIALFCDFSHPQASFYRPPLRFNAFDGSLALPQSSLPWQPESLQSEHIETWVNGHCVQRYSTADWVCSATQQLEAVSAFIAWEAGDVLMLGCPLDAPLVQVGDVVEARMSGQVFTRTVIALEELA
jgi:5-oxopent-3-ene-1,2,5-tricarboxylate decarboxylase / 2-hydroxyhepta-2,4-diene-1,7-dioate isomerase